MTVVVLQTQDVGVGKDLLTRISVGRRKAMEGMYMVLRKSSDSPRSEENIKIKGRNSNSDLV